MDRTRLEEILRLHSLWVVRKEGGEQANLRGANLRGANLSYANLRGANLGSANLSSANLRGANLGYANLSSADLGYANLSYANLSSADLGYANLGSANLRGANLGSANLSSANLRGANLGYADLGSANLSSANLRGATGNMREVKSLHIERWTVVWTQSPSEITSVQIGCQVHPLGWWEEADENRIKSIDPNGWEAWQRLGPTVLSLIRASPAVPWGSKATETAAVDDAAAAG
jgi:hypothetical protein